MDKGENARQEDNKRFLDFSKGNGLNADNKEYYFFDVSYYKKIAFITTILNLIVSLIIYMLFDFSNNQFQFIQENLDLSFYDIYLGVDGLSIYFVVRPLIKLLNINIILLLIFKYKPILLRIITELTLCKPINLLEIEMMIGMEHVNKVLNKIKYKFYFWGKVIYIHALIIMLLQSYILTSKILDTKTHSFARPALFTLQQKMRLYPNFTKSGILLQSSVKYSTTSRASKDLSNISPKFYENADTQKLEILMENQNKSGIYQWVNKSGVALLRNNSIRSYSTSTAIPFGWITGFVDGEGSFVVSIRKSLGSRLGLSVEPKFSIGLHQKDRGVLEQIKDYLGVGHIYNQGFNGVQFHVKSVKELEVVIMHFDKYPLISQKYTDSQLWREVVMMMLKKEHLTLEGLKKIVALKASLNLGLLDELKEVFPNIVPVKRAIVDQKIRDSNWVASFTSAEGCFFVNIIRSPIRRTGFQIKLNFTISQHVRDEQLIRSLVEYFDCGKIYLGKEAVWFVVTKYSDISDKIIPFFQEHKILGVKSKDFEDFCNVADIMKDQSHLNPKGLEQIKKIKEGMNKGRNGC